MRAFLFGPASHWFEPLEDGLPSLQRAREACCAAVTCRTRASLHAADDGAARLRADLSHFSADVEAALAFSERTANRVASITFTGLRNLVTLLQA